VSDPLRAVLFDLDDTLFEQATWLSGAWDAVAGAAPDDVDRDRFRSALGDICAEGSDKGAIIDRALARVGRSDLAVAPLLAAFRSHAPRALSPYPGVIEAIESLRGTVALGLVSDGDPTIQRNKLHALGLGSAFDIVVLSDELGREHRKPSPVPLLAALVGLGVEARATVYIGDRPDKDTAAANAGGIRAIRVSTGEYASRPDDPQPWATAPGVAAAVAGLRELSGARTR
jgi:putative hydrolase of the HAD superfamily